ncbi:type II toxin-antitoxin system mRNA interferase toxin, RelE/StbE family [Duganella sp. FT80W]|uniref:Type II toxin-antitoxin system mRNA interferase toxin, RelE/StbE family n=1 Tax=Duganella guangzhouensis TaxID=2666084 RepID=A0A6I2L9Y1_9BURK|nr:type II toxin-antitoxin system mRNA interferase toxin, RelE/StbE family [Duganella guangzhouensis]
MWQILEHHRVEKRLAGKTPLEVRQHYEKWLTVVQEFGPSGLRAIPGFHDEALQGKWLGHRSSRLGHKWRVIYLVVGELLQIHVIEVIAHDYKRH